MLRMNGGTSPRAAQPNGKDVRAVRVQAMHASGKQPKKQTRVHLGLGVQPPTRESCACEICVDELLVPKSSHAEFEP
jgi:hypothetical protein